MTVSNQLVVPLTLWGSVAPTHCISSIYFTQDQRTIVTGCYDGQICLWDISESLKITPRCLLFGHTAPVLCLAPGSNALDSTFLVSSSEAGEMSLWDISDGRCLESTKMPYVHINIQAYHMAGASNMQLFCNGYYSDILIIDVMSLEVVLSLSSRLSPDWISAMHVLRPAKKQDDVVVALSNSGIVKVWTLTGNETKAEPVFENESKPVRCLNALKLTCCAYNQRTVLIVCTKYWQVYDAVDFSLLCSTDNRRGERWTGGDFVSADKVVAWSDAGKGYLFKLPTKIAMISDGTSSIAGNKDFHSQAAGVEAPILYSIICFPNDERLLCPPAMNYFLTTRGHIQRLLFRGDSAGRIAIWEVPDISENDFSVLQRENFAKPLLIHPKVNINLQECWDLRKPAPAGIVDHMSAVDSQKLKITSSVYLPLQGRLVCGREDGSIIIVSGMQTAILQLLRGRHQSFTDWPPHQVLHGHTGRVTCLLYPHHLHSRYSISHLVSGGVDFSVCLWDIYAGSLLHRFCIHAGEITQLLVTPNNCNPRVIPCICSVASDHSVALISLKDQKCVMLASRHLFPVQQIKWRPLDDFMVVGCADGSVYVWQLETGHLDRVAQGLLAEEILSACDEVVITTGDKLTNPAIHFFRGLRHRNLAAIRHAAQRGLHQLQHAPTHHQQHASGMDTSHRGRAHPLMIQGLRTNPKDQDSHVLFFDIEALIVQLVSEEYANTNAGQELQQQAEVEKSINMTNSPDPQRRITGILSKVKDHAESAAQKIQAKAESVGFRPVSGELTIGGKVINADGVAETPAGTPNKKVFNIVEGNLTMEIAQLLLSLLHAWGLDSDLDKVCENKLGLLKPLRPVCFGLLSRGGHMSLLLPTYMDKLISPPNTKTITDKPIQMAPPMPPEMRFEEERAAIFSSHTHWELSAALTTNHLVTLVALANTLMSMSKPTFIPEQERKRKLQKKLSRADSKGLLPTGTTEEMQNAAQQAEAEALSNQQTQIKQGWSLLAALHCILLPDLVKSPLFRRAQVEMLARRWQDRCLEIREGAQALLLAELRRIGPSGRKLVVDEWAPYLPNYGEPYPGHPGHVPGSGQHPPPNASTPSSSNPSPTTEVHPKASTPLQNKAEALPHSKGEGHGHSSDEEDDELHGLEGEATIKRPSSSMEGRRKQATAIVLLGVIGAEYGHEIEQSKRRTAEEQKKKSVVEGFGLENYSLARHTSHALAYLLLAPPSPQLPAHTSLRRAAIDLIGRGFTVWEPYLDVSKILLGLLELCCDSDRLIPNTAYGLPLTPVADSCRTARHALSLIATARPPAFITTLAREVARFNTLAQNAQSLNISLHNTVLSRARPEILRVVETLIEKMQTDVADLIVQVMDIVIHCLDPVQLKTKGLSETFPAICRFHSVSYCPHTRRIAVGAKTGNLALYELRASKSQSIPAHAAGITACSFSPDGKYLASYSAAENKLCFWQTAAGLFGLGNTQTKCVRTYSTTPLPDSVKGQPLKMAQLVWISNKIVILLLSNGVEYRYSVT